MDLPDDYVERIKQEVERSLAYEERAKLANQRNREEKDELVSTINAVLGKHQVAARISGDHIEFRADFITNIYSEDKLLTNIIYDLYFPVPDQHRQYYHYTSVAALKSILEKQELRLYNLNKRFQDEEFVIFYREHEMDGYEQGGSTLGVRHTYRDIMDDIFYISFTELATSKMWVDFAQEGEGVRLGLEIETHHQDFRRVYYATAQANAQMTLIKDLEECVRTRWGLPLVFSTVSKIGAFYIKGSFSNEYEVRFLLKTSSDSYGSRDLEAQAVTTNEAERIRYITLPLRSRFGTFSLKAVQPGYHCAAEDITEIQALLARYSPTTQLLAKAVEQGEWGY